MRVLTVGVLIFCAPALVRPLAAEELLVQGMGRTVGWVVATSDGQLAFRDCGGRLLRVRDGRIERAKRTCPAAKRGRLPVTRAKVRAVDLANKIVVVEDGGGDLHAYHYAGATGAGDAKAIASLNEIRIGDAVMVESRVSGRAATLRRP